MNDMFKRSEWFRQDRFGMFIHWGIYSIPGRGEWIRSQEMISIEDYQCFFNEFNPIDYNPKEWAKAAKAAGMKYVVLTAKHHDGFCLFDSKLTDYKATNTKAGRDLIAEYVEAIRAEGLKVGLYYSLIDWHHPDFPKYGDKNHPMRDNIDFKDEKIDFDNYLKYMHGQVEELVSNYGKIDLLWFDFSYNNLNGEAWKATELIKMVRSHQPDVLVDNRLEASGEGFGSIVTEHPNCYSGDFASPEQIIPPEGIVNVKGEAVPWELCATMNNNWGYVPTDHDFKSPTMLIRKLVECVSKGGNMILNVGPDARGVFPERSTEILKELSKWMNKNSASIYGCGNTGIPKPEWGRYTGKGNKIYAHIFEAPLGQLALTGIDPNSILSMRRLCDGSEVLRGESWNTSAYSSVAYAAMGRNPICSYPLPDEIDTVIEITLK